ncbi:hypothetical protein BDZ94DRAFT_1233709 [Collybia nuda]|uniref:ARID domain-containing protein n=1 Tax=Collybia nuda TaxID=64659 RepID=A0A9P5YF19_9AGAR|nr:hypothetical protein BDZ94DRAFT_1233709 [Collybia nuda]
MVPSFNTGLIQQQQQQQLNHQQTQQHQQQQHQQPHQQQEHPNLPGFPDQGRMWQQIQHMQQFRGGGDMNNAQANSQMMDLLRSQNLARAQSQQQQQQLNQQHFALQQMANSGNARPGGAPQQPQSFHDPSTNQQPHMAGGFPAVTPGAAPLQSLNSRNATMMAFQASQGTQPPHLSRQLDLMLAQNQQPQNGMVFPNRLEQQQRQQQQQQQQQRQQAQQQHLQAMNQSSPGDMFSSPGMPTVDRRPSPAHSNIQPPNPMGGQQPQQPQPQPGPRRPITLSEMTERATALRAHIASQEQMLKNYSPPPGADPAIFTKATLELKARKEYLGKLVIMIQNQTGAVNNMNAMHAAAAAQQQQANGSGQGSWQGGSSQPFENSPGQMARTPMPSHQGQINPQPSPGHNHAQVQGNHTLNQSIAPPRTGQTPHQLTATSGNGGVPGGTGSFSNQMSPHMGQPFPYPQNGANNIPASVGPSQGPTMAMSMSMQLPPPLEKARFDNAYKSFVQNRNIKHEMGLMNVEGRQIDLHALHTYVMQEGGYNKVQSNDLWATIGGKMGFIHFPGTDTEPAKAGPGTAQRLAVVYKDYLGAFDMVYINSVFESRKKLYAAHASVSGGLSGAGMVPQPGMPVGPRGALSPHQMQSVIGYANQSVADLRAQGVSEKMIQFVEANRAHLQRTRMEQGMFRERFQQAQRSHGGPDGLPGFSGSSPQPNPGVNSNQRPFVHGGGGTGGGFVVDGRQPPQQQPQQPSNFQIPTGRPSKEQLAGAMAFIVKTKTDFQKNRLPNMRHPDIPNEQRPEFNALIEQLHHYAQEMDGKLSMYYFVLNSEELIKQLIAIIVTVAHQRTLLSVTGSPRFIVSLENLRGMTQQMQKSSHTFTAYLQSMMNRNQQVMSNGHPIHQPLDMARSSLPQHTMPPQPMLPNRPPVNLRPPPKKLTQPPPQPSSSAPVSTPTPPPAYSPLTPAANPPTPNHGASSPQAPKSPKGKAPPKAKAPPKRKMSVKNTPAAAPTEQQPQTPASNSGPSNASGSGSGNTIKRQRDEEPSISSTLGASPSSGSVANEPSPPKRIKTEWDGPPDEALQKKNEAAENIKTEEDTSVFLERMTELIKMAAGGEGQESLTSDISDTLDQILKGYSDTPGGILSGMGESSRMHGPSSSSPPPTIPIQDEVFEFIDFSSFGNVEDDDDGSKAPTPDLLSSSSTNPSPESGSEADAAHHALLSSIDKTDDGPDPLRLGPWKEIDGGESAYYQSNEWKWDSPMSTQEWAIFPS